MRKVESIRRVRRRTGSTRSEVGPAPPLSRRETEILRHVAAGLQNKEVAHRLGLSLATVRNHVHNILDKLGVHSKLEAVSLAFRNGWVSGEVPGTPIAQAKRR